MRCFSLFVAMPILNDNISGNCLEYINYKETFVGNKNNVIKPCTFYEFITWNYLASIFSHLAICANSYKHIARKSYLEMRKKGKIYH